MQVVRTVRDSARTEALVLPEERVFAEAAGQETTVHRVRRGERGGVREGGRGEGGIEEGREGRSEGGGRRQGEGSVSWERCVQY